MRGTVEIEANGRTYTLRFTTNALCRLEEAAGRSFGALVDDLGGAVNMNTLRLMIWAGIGGIGKEVAGDIIDAIGIERAVSLIGEAINAAFPQPEGDTGNGEAAA